MTAMDPAIVVAMDESAGGPSGLVLICAAPPAGHQIPNVGELGLDWDMAVGYGQQRCEFHCNRGWVTKQMGKPVPVRPVVALAGPTPAPSQVYQGVMDRHPTCPDTPAPLPSGLLHFADDVEHLERQDLSFGIPVGRQEQGGFARKMRTRTKRASCTKNLLIDRTGTAK